MKRLNYLILSYVTMFFLQKVHNRGETNTIFLYIPR